MSARYAIYFAPPAGSPWWTFAARWLGRDEIRGTALPFNNQGAFGTSEQSALTAAPRRYGFHATLKAPFRLADGCDETQLIARLHELVQTHEGVDLAPLMLATLGDFVALVPGSRTAELQSLAAHCVTELDDLRAPLDELDLARRRVSELDARESELLARYGYPYVMERFRFHMTLTGSVGSAIARRVCKVLEPEINRLNREAPLVLDRLCLFKEPDAGEPFVRVADLELKP